MHNFSGKRARAIELLAQGEMTQVAIAKELKISPQSITKYKKNPEFMAAVVERSRQLLREQLPEVYGALRQKSKKGSDRHIKIYLDHLEKLEEARASQVRISFTWQVPDDQ